MFKLLVGKVAICGMLAIPLASSAHAQRLAFFDSAAESETTKSAPESIAPPDPDEVFSETSIPWTRGFVPWTPRVDALYLRRADPDSRVLVSDAVTGAGRIDVKNADFEHEIGLRVGLRKSLDFHSQVDVGYFGSFFWGSSQSATGNLAFDGPGFRLGVNPGTFQVAQRSRLHGAHLHWRHEPDCRFAFLGGLRWYLFDDELTVNEVNFPFPAAAHVKAGNNLLGSEVGGEAILWEIGGRFRLIGRGTTGVYWNILENEVESSFLGPRLASEKSGLAWSGEAALDIQYLLTDHISIRAGYQVLGLSGLALAPEQLRSNNLATGARRVDNDESLIFDGGHFGVEIVW